MHAYLQSFQVVEIRAVLITLSPCQKHWGKSTHLYKGRFQLVFKHTTAFNSNKKQTCRVNQSLAIYITFRARFAKQIACFTFVSDPPHFAALCSRSALSPRRPTPARGVLIHGLFSSYQLNAHFLYSITIYMLHYNPQYVSSSTLLIFRRANYIITASGIVTLCKQPYSMPVESGLQTGIPLQIEHTYTQHILCCCVTTLTFYIFNKF